jgi:hypothetical protein
LFRMLLPVKARIRNTTRRPRGLTKKSTAYRSHSCFAQRDAWKEIGEMDIRPCTGIEFHGPDSLEKGVPRSSDRCDVNKIFMRRSHLSDVLVMTKWTYVLDLGVFYDKAVPVTQPLRSSTGE